MFDLIIKDLSKMPEDGNVDFIALTNEQWGKVKALIDKMKEEEIDWSKVAVDTPILVSNDGECWQRRYFAQYENGYVYAWLNGGTSWTSYEDICCSRWEYAKFA